MAYERFNNIIIAWKDYSGWNVCGDYNGVTFVNCDFTNASLSGTFYNCKFDRSCTFEGTYWTGDFNTCQGVGQ